MAKALRCCAKRPRAASCMVQSRLATSQFWSRRQVLRPVALRRPIQACGLNRVAISLQPEVEAMISVTVARNADEAQRLGRGEDLAVDGGKTEDPAAAAAAAAEAFFEPEAIAAQRAREGK